MKKKTELPKVNPVHIKPLFGLKPGIWLTMLYSLIILLAVFLICFLPGIKNGSMRVSFTSEAYNSAVYIDGNYRGGTPFTVKVPSGKHNVEFRVNNCLLDSMEIEVKHPVFLTWLFPRKMSVSSSATLTDKAYEALTKEFFEDLVLYSAIKEYSAVHPYPNLFTEYAKCVLTYPKADFSLLTDYAVCFITTDEMQKDAENAFALLNIGNVAIPEAESTEPGCPDVVFGNTVVTEYEYSLFTSENPEWKKENKDNLIELGLVDSYYLEGTGNSKMKAIVNVSYYAAEAYCKWLSKKTNANYTLPTEEQWISKSLESNSSFVNSLLLNISSDQIFGMFGGVWEMTCTSFIPNGYSSEIEDFLENLGVETEFIVKGGSYISTPSEISSYSRGISSKSLCSDYMGFRVICHD